MSILFEEIKLNDLSLKNRFVRSATWDGLADPQGDPTPAMTGLLTSLARGEVGLIVSGHAFIRPEGRASQGQLGIHDDSLVPGLAGMVREIHEAGGKIAVQLAHSGMKAPVDLTKTPALAPSAPEDKSADECREMTLEEIRETVRSYGLAALRAREAGFDAVQIHSAHGYLLSQFLSPAHNRRTDDYGGSPENRSRFLLETVQEIRAQLGPDFPLLVKLNCRDFIPGGMELEESLKVGQALERAGVDALEISGGSAAAGKLGPSRTGLKNEDREAYFRQEAGAFKQALSIPIILVGGIRSLGLAENLVENGTTDLISMCRPFIRQPDLIKKWRTGKTAKASCISDNLCFVAGSRGGGVFCLTEERQMRKKG